MGGISGAWATSGPPAFPCSSMSCDPAGYAGAGRVARDRGRGGGSSRGRAVRGHGMTGKEASHHCPQPLALLGLVLVPASPEVFLDLQELRHFPVPSRMAGQQKAPCFDREQIWVKPRKSKVSGLPAPRAARLDAAVLPNSIRHVLSGCSSKANSAIRVRNAAKNRSASARCSKPTIVSSA